MFLLYDVVCNNPSSSGSGNNYGNKKSGDKKRGSRVDRFRKLRLRLSNRFATKCFYFRFPDMKIPFSGVEFRAGSIFEV